MRRHRLLILLLALSIFSGCSRSKEDAIMAPYLPALLPEAQPQLGELLHLPRYDISVRIDPSQVPQLSGREQVWLQNREKEELNELYFRLYPNLTRLGGGMSIGGVAVDGQNAPFTYEEEHTALHIALAEPLAPGSAVSVDLTFDLQVDQREEGWVLLGQSQSILSLPLFYPLLAVRDASGTVPGWNLDLAPSYFGDVAFAETGLYQVSATVPADMVVVGTGTVISTTLPQDGFKDIHFAGGPRREFMLIMSPQFQSASLEGCGSTVTSYFLPPDGVTGQAALQYAAAALRIYCQHFGPYPYRDMAVVSAPLRYFGMEYPGVNLIGIDLYRTHRSDLEFLVAHEVAHQWWYNVVGNDPVNFAWLDEGLAEYSTYAYYADRYGSQVADGRVELRWVIPYDYAVGKGYDVAVGQPLSGFDASSYETMVYAKAALFFHALRTDLEDELYEKVLAEYLDRYRWGVAVPADFLAVAEEVSGRDLGDLYTQWILTPPLPEPEPEPVKK